ncbi:hypothetical protein M3Y99_01385400 [Aphelenchoides fujianensis]|nr:hypothetical protein M3Y99_01385400 [Aphelenchoides fujianensis]
MFTGWWEWFFHRSKWVYAVYVLVHLFFYATFFVPELVSLPDDRAMRLQFVQENPELADHVGRRLFACFPSTKASHDFIFYAICILVLLFCAAVACDLTFYCQIRQAEQKTVARSTYEMQRMLFVALNSQLLVACVFVALPMLVALLQNGSELTAIVLNILSWHGVVDYFLMLYFISPWRREIGGWIRRATGKQTTTSRVSDRQSNSGHTREVRKVISLPAIRS